MQGLALALGALPVWYLAIQAQLSQAQAYGMAVAYLLYPVVFNANLFDFPSRSNCCTSNFYGSLDCQGEKIRLVCGYGYHNFWAVKQY